MFSYVFGQIPLDWRNTGHSKIFVAHSFHDQKKTDLRSTIRRAFEPELTPYYADTELDASHLLIKLARRIEVSRLFVGDLSQISPNVMIELGIAIGRNKKILLCGSYGMDFPKFLWGVSAIRYSDYKMLEEDLDRQKTESADSLLSPSSTGWCQFCRLLCSGRSLSNKDVNPGRAFVVDDSAAGFQADFLSAIKTSLDEFEILPFTLSDAEKSHARILCAYVQALRSSKIAFFRFVPGMSPIVAFLFGLSFGLEVYPVVVAEKGSNIIPSDLLGFDRIDYQSFHDITEQLHEKLPAYIESINKSATPAEWMKLDSKARDALTQIQNFLTINPKRFPDDSEAVVRAANEDKMQIALALGLYAIRCSAGSLMVKTPQGKLRIKALVAPSAEMDAVGEWREFDINEGICGWVTRTRQPYLTGDRNAVSGDDINYARRSFDRNLASLACVPIIHEEEVVGVINADSREQDFFRESDLEVLGIVARLLAPTVANEFHNFDQEDYSKVTEVESELQKGHVCMNCGQSTVVLGFKRKDDEEGLRYRMYLRCTSCNHTYDIHTYSLRST